MNESLERMLVRLRKDEGNVIANGVEETVRQGVVLPILGCLGWDRDNVREVIPEYTVGGGRVDYCLRTGNRELVFLEVKRATEDLDSESHQEQLLAYAFRAGVKMAVLTNGFRWWLYLSLRPGAWQERKFLAIDIQQQEVKAVVGHLRKFLGREAVSSGSAVRDAEALHASREKERRIKETIPAAWKAILTEPDELLADLLAERVESMCGHKPRAQSVSTFLSSFEERQTATPKEYPSPERKRRPAKSVGAGHGLYTKTRVAAYSLWGETHRVANWKDLLLNVCKDAHKRDPDKFQAVFQLQGRKQRYFSRDPRDLRIIHGAPKKIPGTDIYVLTQLSANGIVNRCRRVLKHLGYSGDQLEVHIRTPGG